MTTTATSTLVYCGNGGDWEFEQERIYWVVWIKSNLKTDRFKVFSQSGIPGDKAIVSFADPKLLTMFILSAPLVPPAYTQAEIEKIFNGRDAMRAYR